MHYSNNLDLLDFDPKIKRSFHQIQREQWEKIKQQKDTIGDNNQSYDPPSTDVRNLLASMVRAAEVNEWDILMDEYMMSPIFENLPFYGRTNENLHYHLSRFMEYCRNFTYQGVNDKALRMRLFHTF
ncbi:Uncharacterized protein Adt_33387 [Abeliophyllum distichum]|uniref:Uncharacterized protein n=1 Tax=Abeliophyllum distichum TaxID=126358 RepID=A0ABD1QX01_9LAMI